MIRFRKKKKEATAFEKNKIMEKIAEPEKEMMYFESELGKAIYQIEHRIMPEQFFRETRLAMGAWVEKSRLYKLFDMIFNAFGVDNTYEESDISSEYVRLDSDLHCLKIEFPEPELVPLCYRAYLLCDDSFSNPMYVTVEKGAAGDFLCGWTADNKHVNYGKIASAVFSEENKAFMQAIEYKIVMDLYRGDNPLEKYQNK